MSLVAVNVYAERLEGEVVVWLVFSQPTGQVFSMTVEPDEVPLLVEALQKAHAQARVLEEPEPRLCALCGERPGKAIYGGHCLGCFEARRSERDEF